jgi:hypothetical protein
MTTRPAVFCGHLLAALTASEGRRRRRARNTTPDAIGLEVRRVLLERVTREDPAPEAFEAWLMDCCLEAGPSSGPLRAIALGLLEEWRLLAEPVGLKEWLERGAPSDDAAADRA